VTLRSLGEALVLCVLILSVATCEITDRVIEAQKQECPE